MCLLAGAGMLATADAAAQQPAVASGAPAIPASASSPSVAPSKAPDKDNVTIYDQAFFTRYSVVTARDILERIPGMASVIGASFANAEQQRRGLRSDTDQILINGKRTTSKESDVSDFLQRIPANQVLRVEVISGNVKEIDSSVSGRVVNVVLKGGAGGGSGAFAIGGFASPVGIILPSAELSYSYESGGFSVTAGVDTRSRVQPVKALDTYTTPAGVPTGRRYENRERDRADYTARLRTGYSFPGGAALQVSGYGYLLPFKDADTSEIYGFVGTGERLTASVQDLTDGHERRAEVSTDMTLQIGNAIKVLGLGVYSNAEIDSDSRIFDFLSGSRVETAGDARNEVKIQKIARLTVQADVTSAQELEVGAEGAKTSLNKDLDFFNLVGGRRVDIPVFNSDTTIHENRAELFSTYSWKPVSTIEIEPGIAAEFSKLKQRGRDANVTRTFNFVKPSFNIWYSPVTSTRFFLAAVRDVGQLTFEDFAASFIREDNEVVAGNPNLVPERTWAFELGVEHRLPNDAGLLQTRGFYKRISDVSDEVPLGPGGSGPGNLGRGTSYGAQFEWSFKLAKMGLFDATTGGTLTIQDSSVRDAFTGRNRRIGRQPEYELKIDYRHDVASLGAAYGFEFNKTGANVESDFGKFDSRIVKRGDFRFSFEKKFPWGIVVRTFMGNALRQKAVRDRTVFAVSQADGRVLRREHREERSRYFVGLRVRGNY